MHYDAYAFIVLTQYLLLKGPYTSVGQSKHVASPGRECCERAKPAITCIVLSSTGGTQVGSAASWSTH